MEKNRGPTFCFFGQKTENHKPVFSILFFFFSKNRNAERERYNRAKSVFFGRGKISGKKKTKTGPDIIQPKTVRRKREKK